MKSKTAAFAVMLTLLTIAVAAQARYSSNSVWSFENSSDIVFEIDQLVADSILQGNLTLTNSKWINALVDWSNIREFVNYTNNTIYFAGHLPGYYAQAGVHINATYGEPTYLYDVNETNLNVNRSEYLHSNWFHIQSENINRR